MKHTATVRVLIWRRSDGAFQLREEECTLTLLGRKIMSINGVDAPDLRYDAVYHRSSRRAMCYVGEEFDDRIPYRSSESYTVKMNKCGQMFIIYNMDGLKPVDLPRTDHVYGYYWDNICQAARDAHLTAYAMEATRRRIDNSDSGYPIEEYAEDDPAFELCDFAAKQIRVDYD